MKYSSERVVPAYLQQRALCGITAYAKVEMGIETPMIKLANKINSQEVSVKQILVSGQITHILNSHGLRV